METRSEQVEKAKGKIVKWLRFPWYLLPTLHCLSLNPHWCHHGWFPLDGQRRREKAWASLVIWPHIPGKNSYYTPLSLGVCAGGGYAAMEGILLVGIFQGGASIVHLPLKDRWSKVQIYIYSQLGKNTLTCYSWIRSKSKNF